MKTVGDTLAAVALTPGSDETRDLHGRSAFNRYYYAIFLHTRQYLRDFGFVSEDDGPNHSDYPGMLVGSVLRRIKAVISRRERDTLINHSDARRLKALAHEHLTIIADTMSTAYRIRVVADYEPSVQVHFQLGSFSLENTKWSTASTWATTVQRELKSLRTLCFNIGL
jgi:hypothetical protein